MYIDCKNCALFDSDECQEYRTECHSLRTCDNYQAQRYFILAGVEHVSKDGRYRLNSDYERLEHENARIKARIMNIEEGLSRLGEFIAIENRTPELQNYLAFDSDRDIYTLVKWDGAEMVTADSMPDLIDNILINNTAIGREVVWRKKK